MKKKDTQKGRLSSDSDTVYGAYTAPPGGDNMRDTPRDPGKENDSNKKRSWWRREKPGLQRSSSLDKVDEDAEQEGYEERKSYPGKLFGVKSYLHHFYDARAAFKDPTIYEDEDDSQYLLYPNQRRPRCTSIWWKVFVWIGANFLVFGIIGVLVGYLVPQRSIFKDDLKLADDVKVLDRGAIEFNYTLYVFKLVGLVLFCIGGLTLAVALLFPSFLYHYCEVYDDRERRGESDPIRVSAPGGSGGGGSEEEEKPPLSPLEMQVPTSSHITGIQPDRKPQESIVTQEGMYKYTE